MKVGRRLGPRQDQSLTICQLVPGEWLSSKPARIRDERSQAVRSHTMIDPSDAPTPETAALAYRYADAALKYAAAVREGDHRSANSAYDEMASIVRELRAGEFAQATLDVLMLDSRLEVRGWAAVHALEFNPKFAEEVLEEVAAGPQSLVAFGAGIALQEWRAGRLQFP